MKTLDAILAILLCAVITLLIFIISNMIGAATATVIYNLGAPVFVAIAIGTILTYAVIIAVMSVVWMYYKAIDRQIIVRRKI